MKVSSKIPAAANKQNPAAKTSSVKRDVKETIINAFPDEQFLFAKALPFASEKVNELYSLDKISLVQKGKMMDNLSKLQMMTSKEKKFFKKLENNS